MRLWHYKLLPVLPNKFIIAEWRECIAIKRQWEKGTLKHRLVSYVMDYDKSYFCNYITLVANEMNKRKIRFKEKYLDELFNFSANLNTLIPAMYPEHNDRYLKQCIYNLEEKYDRGIISQEEFYNIIGVGYKENIIE